jgi:hypothetical protein
MKPLWILFLLSVVMPVTQAHEVPDRVNINVFVKPEQDRLVILVRIPANALIDYLLPTLPEGNWVDLAHADSLAAQGANVWIADLLSFRENDKQLQRPQLVALRLSRVNDPAFRTFDDALARINGAPLSPETLALQEQLSVDAVLQTPISSPAARFNFEPRFAHLGVVVETALTFLPASGGVREFRYQSDPPPFDLDVGGLSAVTRFAASGFDHFFAETDYLLLALCIALVIRSLKALLPFAAALITAQGLSLLISLTTMSTSIWLRGMCGTAIAATIVYVGIEAIVAGEGRRLVLALVVGTVFGYGFWIGLQPIVQFGGAHDVLAGIGFLSGVIAAELLTLLLCIAAVRLLLSFSRAQRGLTIVVAGAAIHVAWRNLLDRADALAIVPLESRGIDSTTLTLSALAIFLAIVAYAYYKKTIAK